MIRDISLVEGHGGRLVVHRIDCPAVRIVAALGHPVLTMIDIERPIPRDETHVWHDCMEEA